MPKSGPCFLAWPRRKEREVLAWVLFLLQPVAGAPATAVECFLVLVAVYQGCVSNMGMSVNLHLNSCPDSSHLCVFASRDRDGDHGTQQASRAGGRRVRAGAEHHGRGEERCRHVLGERAVEQVATWGPSPAVGAGVLQEGLPPASPWVGLLLSPWDDGMRRWAQQ